MQLKAMSHLKQSSFSQSSANFCCIHNLKFNRLSCPVYFGSIREYTEGEGEGDGGWEGKREKI